MKFYRFLIDVLYFLLPRSPSSLYRPSHSHPRKHGCKSLYFKVLPRRLIITRNAFFSFLFSFFFAYEEHCLGMPIVWRRNAATAAPTLASPSTATAALAAPQFWLLMQKKKTEKKYNMKQNIQNFPNKEMWGMVFRIQLQKKYIRVFRGKKICISKVWPSRLYTDIHRSISCFFFRIQGSQSWQTKNSVVAHIHSILFHSIPSIWRGCRNTRNTTMAQSLQLNHRSKIANLFFFLLRFHPFPLFWEAIEGSKLPEEVLEQARGGYWGWWVMKSHPPTYLTSRRAPDLDAPQRSLGDLGTPYPNRPEGKQIRTKVKIQKEFFYFRHTGTEILLLSNPSKHGCWSGLGRLPASSSRFFQLMYIFWIKV